MDTKAATISQGRRLVNRIVVFGCPKDWDKARDKAWDKACDKAWDKACDKEKITRKTLKRRSPSVLG